MFDHNSHIIMSTHRLLFTMLALVMALACAQGADAASTPLQVSYSLDYALNVAGGSIHFTSVGAHPWTSKEEDGRIFGRSGNAGIPSSASVLSAQVVVARDAVLTFDFKAWGEGDGPLYDKCVFTIDGASKFNYGARQNDWEAYEVEISAGPHTLTWSYSKDGSMDPDGDYFAVDNVSITVTSDFIPGDVDGDGRVSIIDVTELIDYLLSGNSSAIDLEASDVDGDGRVSIIDVTELIDYLLSGSW